MASVVFQEQVICTRCGLMMALEYTCVSGGSTRLRVECPYCSHAFDVALRRPVGIFAVRPHGTTSILGAGG